LRQEKKKKRKKKWPSELRKGERAEMETRGAYLL
jgi:hypothetical protein